MSEAPEEVDLASALPLLLPPPLPPTTTPPSSWHEAATPECGVCAVAGRCGRRGRGSEAWRQCEARSRSRARGDSHTPESLLEAESLLLVGGLCVGTEEERRSIHDAPPLSSVLRLWSGVTLSTSPSPLSCRRSHPLSVAASELSRASRRRSEDVAVWRRVGVAVGVVAGEEGQVSRGLESAEVERRGARVMPREDGATDWDRP